MKLQILAVFIIISVLSSCRKYAYPEEIEEAFVKYKKAQIVEEAQIGELLKDTTNKFILVDIRTSRQYGEGRLPRAINIPQRKIYDNLSFFKENKQKNIILYGNETSDAVSSSLYLNYLGFNNVKALAGGYKYIYENFVNKKNNADSIYLDETPRYNYAEVFKELSKGTNNQQNQQVQQKVIVPVQQKKSTGLGGCG